MSKKLIAVASAAALALSALVSIPASAADFNVAIDWETGVGATEKTAMTVAVPETNELTSNTTIRFTVTPTADAGTVNVSSTGAVKLLTSAQYDKTGDDAATIATGSQSISENSVGAGNVVVYAYTTSTTAGKLTIANDGNTRSYWIKAVAGGSYSVTAVKFPSTLNSTTDSDIEATVTDVFGNAITGGSGVTFASLSDGTLAATYLGSAQAGADSGAFKYNTTKKVWISKVKGKEASGAASMVVTLTPTLADQEAAGLPTPVLSAFGSTSSVDLADQVKNLTAQVAALTASYNALAAKWNKRVASKTAPKKKVALK
jgi:hypothetical protein